MTPPSPHATQPCVLCGAMVLSGVTSHGLTLHLDPSQATYAVVWPDRATMPMLLPSSAYVVHRCGQDGTATKTGRKRKKRLSLGSLEESHDADMWAKFADQVRQLPREETL